MSEKLVELDLLVPSRLQVRSGEAVRNYQGSLVLDDQLLSALTDEQLLSLRHHDIIVEV